MYTDSVNGEVLILKHINHYLNVRQECEEGRVLSAAVVHSRVRALFLTFNAYRLCTFFNDMVISIV